MGAGPGAVSLYNAAVAQRQITTTEDQSATFIELFFDLVFVYAVTQTVSLLHEDLSWAGLWHAVVVFWLVWWAWTQYTWALNSADTTHPPVDAVMLVATAIAFLMAVTIPDAFGDAGGWFAATYIAVRVVGLGLYGRVAWEDVAKRTAVRRFAVLSLGGLAAVAAGGVVGGDARAWWWAAAVVLDVAAAVGPELPKAGTSAPSTSASGTGCSSSSPSASRSSSPPPGSREPNEPPRPWRWRSWRWRRPAGCGGATSWVPNPPSITPYHSAAAQIDLRWRETCTASGTFLVFGVVLLAVAIEEAVTHPHEALPVGGSLALAGGVVLFVGSAAAALRQSGYSLSGRRLVILAVIAAGVWVTHGAAVTLSLLVVALGLLLLAAVERPTPEARG